MNLGSNVVKTNQISSHLRNQLVELPVAGSLDVEPVLANVEHGVVVHEEGDVSVLHGAVGSQNGVVRLHYGGRGLDKEIKIIIAKQDKLFKALSF